MTSKPGSFLEGKPLPICQLSRLALITSELLGHNTSHSGDL